MKSVFSPAVFIWYLNLSEIETVFLFIRSLTLFGIQEYTVNCSSVELSSTLAFVGFSSQVCEKF